MEANDCFAKIAMTKHPIPGDEQEIAPLPLPERYFEASGDAPLDITFRMQEDKPYSERIAEFHENLRSLREQYKPFLSDRLLDSEADSVVQLKRFDFRYAKPGEIYTDLIHSAESWERATIPDYRGPAGVEGKWRAYYKTTFLSKKPGEDEHAVLRFQCVDYKAFIYLNGNYVGQHEGFFAPFEFEVTDMLKSENELIVEVHNDIPMLGEGAVLDGDKIYAATGPGWDDPETGWHHCPAGAGIFGKVTLAYRPQIYIEDIFVRPNIDQDYIEIRVGVLNYSALIQENFRFAISAVPRNFEGDTAASFDESVRYIGIGKNEYRYRIPMEKYRLWESFSPCLYGAVVCLFKGEALITRAEQSFGMRKFVSDESTEPRGKFYFNNKPIMLRGANEMGHLQQCVMKGDFEQLIDDILIAKLCNMNYYRITQRPVQDEIYDLFDRLGMMHQTDLPLFGFLRRNQVCEAIRQAGEMEHLLRSHPSSIMVSFINEPFCIRATEDPSGKFSKRYEAKGHRNLLRDELEAFFVAARKVIYIENPDRVIKNVEGDYDPPTGEGMPDFHCYTMWYSNHAVPIGKLIKGYLPPVKKGWMISCGEYGAEGLDNYEIMDRYYPKEWMELGKDGSWYPDKIVRAQTPSMQGDWYSEQTTVSGWIAESQKHQANATRLMTDAFRRRGDVMNQTAIHLLIDAWPAGWMKTLVGMDRIPKPAYFAYADSLEPFRVHLRCDRRYVLGGEILPVEAWLLNDLPESQEGTIYAQLFLNGKKLSAYRLESKAEAATAFCAGFLSVPVPSVKQQGILTLNVYWLGQDKKPIHAERMEWRVYPEYSCEKCGTVVFGAGAEAKEMVIKYNYPEARIPEEADTILVSEVKAMDPEVLNQALAKGKRIVLLASEELLQLAIGNLEISTANCPEVFFAACEPGAEKYSISMLYNRDNGYIDFAGRQSILSAQPGRNIVYSYDKGKKEDSSYAKAKLPFVKQFTVGCGKLTVISLLLKGRLGCNPNVDWLLIDCINGDL